MAVEVVEKIQPYRITLTRRVGASPYIYYYFVHKNKVYRGSTKTDNPKEAKKVAIRIYHEIDSGKTQTKSPKFETVVKKFISYKKNHVTKETTEGYEYRSKYLIEFFQGRDIEAIDKNAFYEYLDWRTNYHLTKKPFLGGQTTGSSPGSRTVQKGSSPCSNEGVGQGADALPEPRKL